MTRAIRCTGIGGRCGSPLVELHRLDPESSAGLPSSPATPAAAILSSVARPVASVDLRFFLTPPVGATEATNPLGMATCLAEIDSNTDILSLARDIVEAFRSDLAAGVIQQSLLHFQLQYEGNPPWLPDVVMITDGGEMPPVRTPPGLQRGVPQ
jgi:Phthiocerol/phthiodiolone dimycocerosyl transferase C-terminus